MGLGKWWLKHGPGSPGSIAKAMVRNFLTIKSQYSSASHEQLLTLTLQERINAERLLGIQPLSKEEIMGIVDESEGDIKKLILLVVHRENPEADNTLKNFPDLYQNMVDVIDEVVNKHL